ncbi:MAG: hypothetical protein JEZ07_04215 [Phycisphaerae bacterium]|nr:hypothetical protein [Phycisphaerae bacterium]
MKLVSLLILIVFLTITAGCNNSCPETTLLNAHSHNDYEQGRPLLDALDYGFCSVEADVFFDGNDLMVAHDKDDIQPGRTLENLYLKPLWQRYEENGAIQPGCDEFMLLIDFKHGGKDIYNCLKRQLDKYQKMLTRLEDGKIMPGKVIICISGARPISIMQNENDRPCFLDGRPDQLNDPGKYPLSLMPLVSDAIYNYIKLNKNANTPSDLLDEDRIMKVIEQCHQQGRKIRFWALPNATGSWAKALQLNIDYINTDDLKGLNAFLIEQK